MPAKTKKVSASPEEKVTVKPVAKKHSAKKSSARKTPAKNIAAKKTVPVATVTVSEEMVPVVTVVEKAVPTTQGSVEVHHKYVFIGSCRNCEHMPMGANKLVAVLSIAIAILSGMIISTSLPTSFELPSISMGSLTNWITPDSNVQSL
ncbi:hypothetical protein EPN81_00030 [Patescibacteria group bacterium]|nr:MAG: hypothetical protein EPN81_00030 [Patescibacteria group bacterium]